jgi:uncharacterized membrane protein
MFFPMGNPLLGASVKGICFLVGGLEHYLFFHIFGIIIPTDQYFSEG